MKLEFTQRSQDIVSFYQYHGWYSDERKFYRIRTRILNGLIVTIPFVIAILWPDSSIKSPIGTALLFLFLFFSGFISAKYMALAYWKGMTKKILKDKLNSDLLGHRIIEFQPDQINWKSETSEGQTKFESIKKIKVDTNNYYLYNSSFSAWVIPKNVFKDDKQIEEFERIIKNYC